MDLSKTTDVDLVAMYNRALARKRLPADALALELCDASLSELMAELGRRLGPVIGAAAASAGSSGPDAGDPLQILTAGDVATMLKMPKAAIYEAARRKQIGSVRASVGSRSGRAVRFTRAQVEAFISSRSVASAARSSSSPM
ncbi:MAG: helix-turn-helix domain-containing protein [Candidatus Binatus sp.]|jgi:hypothetical protein|uniref:helix-turn-helix domain-containing protein n=1 Tax=Candidatus Binatus sp. TaxID=2811406 RepID=UPI003CA37504